MTKHKRDQNKQNDQVEEIVLFNIQKLYFAISIKGIGRYISGLN